MASIAKVSYSHDAMIDVIIANPMINQGEIARHFGYTEGWVSQVFSSDAFQARLAQRKSELVDPLILSSIEENFDAIIRKSQQEVLKKLDAAPGGDFALKVLDITSRARGYGAKPSGMQVNVQQNNYVAHVPVKSVNAVEWMKDHSPKAPAPVIKTTPVVDTSPVLEGDLLLGELANG